MMSTAERALKLWAWKVSQVAPPGARPPKPSAAAVAALACRSRIVGSGTSFQSCPEDVAAVAVTASVICGLTVAAWAAVAPTAPPSSSDPVARVEAAIRAKR